MSTQRTGPSRASRRPPSEVSDHVPLQTGCARPLQAQALLLLLLLAELSCWAQAWTSLEPLAPPSPSFGTRLCMETAGPAPPEPAAKGGGDALFGPVGRALDLLPRLTRRFDPFWNVRVGEAAHPGPLGAGRNRRSRKLKAAALMGGGGMMELVSALVQALVPALLAALCGGKNKLDTMVAGDKAKEKSKEHAHTESAAQIRGKVKEKSKEHVHTQSAEQVHKRAPKAVAVLAETVAAEIKHASAAASTPRDEWATVARRISDSDWKLQAGAWTAEVCDVD